MVVIEDKLDVIRGITYFGDKFVDFISQIYLISPVLILLLIMETAISLHATSIKISIRKHD